MNRALAHGGGTHQTGTVHGAQGGCEQLGCAGGVAVDQTDHGQADGTFGIAAANDGAVAVFILGVGHSALRGDQVNAVDSIFQNAATVVPQVKHQTGRAVCGQGAQGVVQLTRRSAVELADADIAHIVQQLIVHGSAGVARMGQFSRFTGGSAVQPCHGNGSAGLALQGFVHGICAGQALDIGIAYGGNVVAHGDACFLCGRAVVNTGHLGVTGLVDAKLHADTQNLAALDVHQLGVGVGGVVAGVLVARAQQITGGQAVVQGGLIDGVVIVAADVAVHLSDLVVHTFLFFYAVDRAVEQTHGDEHRDGKGHGHGKDHDSDRHTQRNFTVHGLFPPVRAAAS